jgi:hypothetical protein
VIARRIIFPIACIVAWLAIVAFVAKVEATNEAYRMEQRP